MTNNAEPAAALAERKAQLLLTGEAYRIGILQGQMTVVRSLQTKSLLQSVVEQAVGFAGNRLSSALTPEGGGGLMSFIPLAVTSFSYLSGKRFVKPVLGAGLVVATALVLLWRHQHTETAETVPLPTDQINH